MDITQIILLLGAGFIGASLNAIVGGGAFVAFPALIFLGVPPIQANATMTVSLWPGTITSLWLQRKNLALYPKYLKIFIPLSLLGGGIGSIILINMSNESLNIIVPYILLLATMLFTFRKEFVDFITKLPIHPKKKALFFWLFLITAHLTISTYGGFFGAGMGIMLMAFLGLIGITNIHEANAVRNCATACINSVATFIFIISNNIIWHDMIFMTIGAILGGYVCASYAKNIPLNHLRKIVIITAWVITILFFLKYSRSSNDFPL